jgi:putative Holliday junction resolvase
MSTIGVDYGSIRIGVAKQLVSSSIVVPLDTVSPEDFESKLRIWVDDLEIAVVYVGLPKNLSGIEGKSAELVRKWAVGMAEKFPTLKWRFLDERLSTVAAARALSASGKSAKDQRAIIDAYAAVEILEHALDLEAKLDGLAGDPIV